MRANHQARRTECRDLFGDPQNAGYDDPHALSLQKCDEIRLIQCNAIPRSSVGAT